LHVRIAYDNVAEAGFKADWGFACMSETDDESLLFDTGASADLLAYNFERLGVHRRAEIDRIVLSHEHHDHTGGLAAVLHPGATVYVPQSFSRSVKTAIAVSASQELLPGIRTTGELGTGIREQSLVLETSNGMVVMVGCAHPGLEHMLAAAAAFGELYGVIGGFHGFTKLELHQDLRLIVPCHCTAHKKEIAKRYPEQTVRCGVGTVIELP
jgi:7,8-dihydropterin-6-yl-methyl-4-(beta-D-ribofuranosyl)aminobenzene 5'-phosphate synthase